MENRIPEDNEAKKARIQEEIKRRIEAVMSHAVELYELMEPGMTIQCSIEEISQIVTPNATPRVKRLLITRPSCMLEVK